MSAFAASGNSGSAMSQFQKLAPDHLIRRLLAEHDALLAQLDRLDGLVEEYRDAAGTPEARTIATTIRELAEGLVAAEPHHQREEQVLFPALEARGIAMPPRIMRREHEELRTWKHRLLAAAQLPNPGTETIAEPAGTLAGMLRDHIHKENEVLFPMALTVIPESATWASMRLAADKLGDVIWMVIAGGFAFFA